MNISRPKKQTVISIIIIVALSLVAYKIVKSGGDFAASIIVFLTFMAATGTGILLILFRISKIMKSTTHFLYNYFGTLNIMLAFVQVADLLRHGVNSRPFQYLFLNVMIGLAIFYDIYRDKHLTS